MTVTTRMQDNVAIIEFDDGRKNVVNHDVLDQLEAHWDAAEREAAAIVLKGREGSFCAGYDIQVMTGGDRDASARLGARGGALAYRIHKSPVPVVGFAQGHVFTIGLVWLAGCDVRIIEPGPFKLAMSEVAVGVPLTGWALEAVQARLNPQHATQVLVHSMPHDPEAALAAGLVDRVLPPGEGLAAALDAAKDLAKLPAESYLPTKLALRKPVLEVMAEQLPV